MDTGDWQLLGGPFDATGGQRQVEDTEPFINPRPIAVITEIRHSPSLPTSKVYFVGNGADDGSVTRFKWRSSIDGEFYDGEDNQCSHKGFSPVRHLESAINSSVTESFLDLDLIF